MKNWKKNNNRISSAIPSYKANAQKKNIQKFQNNTKNKNKQRISSASNKFNNNKNINLGQNEIWFKKFLEREELKNKNKLKLNNKNSKGNPKENDRYNTFNKPSIPNKKFNFISQNKLPDINNRNINKEKKKLFLTKNEINPFMSAENFHNKKLKVNKIINNNKIHLKEPINNKPIKINNMLNKSIELKRKINNNPVSLAHKKKPNRPQSSIPLKPPKIILITKTCANGLQNIGATCYMNATIQCLAHVQKLTYYFLDSENKIKLSLDENKYELSLAYLTVVENLWQKNNETKYYAPNEFKDVISRKNPLFAGIQANDSKDLIIFLLETMHKELNEPKNNNMGILSDDITSAEQYNFEITFKKFAVFFKDNYNSPISNLFYGMFNSMMQCQNCSITTNNVQCFNILIFPLQKVLEFKSKFINVVNLYECFEYYQRPDYMGGKSFYCNKCRQMADNINTTKILYAPKIMVINLNRGRGLEFDVKLNIDEYIDIDNYVYYKDKSYTYYELIGIVTHFGESSMSGHFIAFCKSFRDQQWYKYNDALVSLSSFNEAKSTGVPYILIYSYIKR